jgi:hypothetical protein
MLRYDEGVYLGVAAVAGVVAVMLLVAPAEVKIPWSQASSLEAETDEKRAVSL